MQNNAAGISTEQPAEGQTWYMKYGLRGIATATGGLAIFLGLFNAIFLVFSPVCFVFSVWQILCGLVVIMIESPCCMCCVEHIQFIVKFSEMVEQKPLWIKATTYIVAPIPSVIFCFGSNTFLGSGGIIIAGVLYAMVVLRNTTAKEVMRQKKNEIINSITTRNSSEA